MKSRNTLVWLAAIVLLGTISVPPLFVFTLPKEMVMVHAMPDNTRGFAGSAISRLALFRISLWRECPVELHGPSSVIGAAIASYHGSSTSQKKVIWDLVAELVEIGCSPNQYGKDGFTPLMDAVLSADEEVVSMLLTLGADPLLRVQASNTGVSSLDDRPRKTLGMNVLEFAQCLQAKGVDRPKERGAIVEVLAHHVQQKST